ncbi:YjgF-like protein [Epithele typhae]|uniref:YjgF-like protein n=1 Tax=Epithele typhae TaxID=378194 RepID=UPI0020072F81|nr:YjgF-like protein [Epithele typhae]KAH9916944.1 YjgF-like protein [Epithele typhae]
MQKHTTGNPYEKRFGYSRAVRQGPFIFVSGTTSIDPQSGEILHPSSAFKQAQTIFEEIFRAIKALGGDKTNVVRVRMFITNSGDADQVGTAFKEALGDVAPAATMLVGTRFVSCEMLVEIEADAVVSYE